MAKTGYKGWTELPLDKEEQEYADKLEDIAHEWMIERGMPETAAKSIRFAFEKASLTISPEEARSGAGHNLADGQPFYRLTIKGGDRQELKNKGYEGASLQSRFMIAISTLYSPAGFSPSSPMVLEYDFRHEGKDGFNQLVQEAGEMLANTDIAIHLAMKPS